jgi:CBS domain-containing membrane protein
MSRSFLVLLSIIASSPAGALRLNPSLARLFPFPTMTASTSPNIAKERVEEYMSRDVVSLTDDMPIEQASCYLSEHKITGAPVVSRDTGVLEGMLSQTDLLYKAAGKARVPLNTKGLATSTARYASNTMKLRKAGADSVAYAMTTPVVSVSPQTSMQEAAALLLRHHVSRLPVTGDDGKLVGILTTTDVMSAVTSDPDGCAIYFNDA